MSEPPSRSRLLITGCGRSGTGFSAAVLSAGGTVGHEGVFGPTSDGTWPEDHPLHVEVSWLAAPHARKFRDSTYIVHQVRDPLLVIRSFLGFGFFERDPSHRFLSYVLRHAPECARWDDPLDQAIQYWLSWNQMAAEAAHERLRLEDLDATHFDRLARLAGLQEADYGRASRNLGRRHNGRRRDMTVTVSGLLRRPLGPELRERAAVYGYSLNP